MSPVEGILSRPWLPLRGPSASCLQNCPEARGGGRIRLEGWRGASVNQPRVKDLADPWGDS